MYILKHYAQYVYRILQNTWLTLYRGHFFSKGECNEEMSFQQELKHYLFSDEAK